MAMSFFLRAGRMPAGRGRSRKVAPVAPPPPPSPPGTERPGPAMRGIASSGASDVLTVPRVGWRGGRQLWAGWRGLTTWVRFVDLRKK